MFCALSPTPAQELCHGAVAATYLAGPRGPEYRRDDETGAVRWYVYDGLGSVVGEVSPDGSLTCTRKLDVYGCVRSSSGTATSKHKFVGSLGHPSDDETGLIYMRARHYDPVTGRFVSEDPGKDGTNWFAYCDDNPLNKADRSGKAAEDVSLQQIEQALSLGFLKYPSIVGFISYVASTVLTANGHERSADVLSIVTGLLYFCTGVLMLSAAVSLPAVGLAIVIILIAEYAVCMAVQQLDNDTADPGKGW